MPITNLESLLNVLKNSDDSIFYSHVNDSRNDFANWIKACIKHESLANNLMSARQKQQFIDILATEVELLKNPTLNETAKFFQEDMGETKNIDSLPKKSVDDLAATLEPNSVSNSKNSSTINSPIIDKSSPINFSASSPNSAGIISDTSGNIVLDFEKFLEPLIQEFENEISQSDQ